MLIRYAGGIELRMRLDTVKPNWDGIRLDTPQLLAVKVRGVEGVGADPGYTVFSGKKYPYDGVLGWWEDGVDFRLTGKNITLAELTILAENLEW